MKRVIVLDSRSLMRESLMVLLRTGASELDLIEAGDAEELSGLDDGESGTVVVISVVDQKGNSDVLERAVAAAPNLPCLLLVSQPDIRLVAWALDQGARGVIGASMQKDSLFPILQLVASGETYIPPDIVRGLAGRLDGGPGGPGGPAMYELNAKQQSVLDMVASGQSNKHIADKLHMRENTVKAHVAQIMRIYGARNRTELALSACQRAYYNLSCPRALGLGKQRAHAED